MFLHTLLSVLCFAASAQSKAIPNAASPATIPVATPTGCGDSITPGGASEVKRAVAGCQGVSLKGEVRNDIIDGICKPFTLLFARGTTELGNIGQLVGPPFVLALEKEFGKDGVAVQGVNDYPAIGIDYCNGGSLTGSQYLAWLVERTMVQCPDTKLCVSGYSQGSQIVHNAAEYLKGDEAATNFINSVVTFGDPDHELSLGDVSKEKWSVVCHKGDDICLNGATIEEPHLSYCHNVDAEAKFVKARAAAKN